MKDDYWGPKPPRVKPERHGPGKAVGEDSLSGAVEHLHSEHPFSTHGEGLQDKATGKIHHPISSGTYKGK